MLITPSSIISVFIYEKNVRNYNFGNMTKFTIMFIFMFVLENIDKMTTINKIGQFDILIY